MNTGLFLLLFEVNPLSFENNFNASVMPARTAKTDIYKTVMDNQQFAECFCVYPLFSFLKCTLSSIIQCSS